MSETRGWADYWKEDGASGEVFVGKDGTTNPNIAAFWVRYLGEISDGAAIIDIASGAGSIYRHIQKPNQYALFASDLSTEALSLLKQRIPGALIAASSASAICFEKGAFDAVVSQFGVEYAGIDAFTEAADLVKPGGKFITLSHIEDGYIDSKNRALLDGAEMVAKLDFISHASALTRAAFSQQEFQLAVQTFQPAERALAAYMNSNPGGIHSHLYLGFRQLFERKEQYALDDIIGWLDAMQADLDRNILRLTSMRSAALSVDDIEIIRRNLTKSGFDLAAEPFEFAEYERPVAWQIIGAKREQ